MKSRAVFALQSPTLLNILAKSDAWQMEVAFLGDHPGREADLLEVPYYQSGRVDHVFVCSPEHWRRAQKEFPAAKLWWLIHNGLPDIIPEDIEPERAVALSYRVRWAQRAVRPELPIGVIVPAYEPKPVWGWGMQSWTMISRPKTRHPDHLQRVGRVRDLSGVPHVLYGEDEPGGFLHPEDQVKLKGACSSYLSALPEWSGFGLAEHECFASGVPVVGSRWGDQDWEMPTEYFALADSLEEQANALSVLCNCRKEGKLLSEMGLDFISDKRNLRQMSQRIRRVLETIP